MSQKERIIDQAMQMFVTQGIKAVRMDDIAHQLCVSKRTLYELFGDKEELLFQALCRYNEQGEARHAELTAHAENVLHAMFIMLNDVMNNSETNHRMVLDLQKFYPSVYDRLAAENIVKHRKFMQECLEQGVAEGLFLDDMNNELSISMLYHAASALFTGRGGVSLPEGMSGNEAYLQVITSFFRGISTTRGIRQIDDYRATHPFKRVNNSNK